MRKRSHARTAEHGALALAALRHRREIVGALMAAGAALMIFVNALFLQHGPHPAPIFATRPAVKLVQPAAPVPAAAPKAAAENAQQQVIANIQRELARRGFYDGVTDGVWGAKTDAALRDFLQAAGLKTDAQPNDALLRVISTSTVKAPDRSALPKDAPRDPIAQLLAPSKRVLAVQRTLADFGYGQIKPTGLYDPDTHAAIERFQHERRLPVNGDISDDLVRELSAVTGRPLE